MARKLSVGRVWTFSTPPPLGLVVVVLGGVSPRAGCEPPRYNAELGGTTVVQYLHTVLFVPWLKVCPERNVPRTGWVGRHLWIIWHLRIFARTCGSRMAFIYTIQNGDRSQHVGVA